MPKQFPHFKQQLSSECGAVCLQMIAKYYGKTFSTERLIKLARQKEVGATLLGISEAAEEIGMHTVAVKIPYHRLLANLPLPGIAHWKGDHFIVVVEAKPGQVVIADPAADHVATISKSAFLEGWVNNSEGEDLEGVILLMEPTEKFEKGAIDDSSIESEGISSIWRGFSPYKKYFPLIISSWLFSLLLMLIFPFLLLTMIDEGNRNDDPGFLNLILISWVILFFAQMVLELIRNYILFELGSKVNITLLIRFMRKILNLPIRFFKSRKSEDVIQVLYDNPRIQRFLTSELLSVSYSTALLLLFSILLFTFDPGIFIVFLFSLSLQAIAIIHFIRKKNDYDSTRQNLISDHYTLLNEMISGVSDIRINRAGLVQRWAWERSEAKNYRISLNLYKAGEFSKQIPAYLADLRNILIIYLAAKAMMENEITLGALVTIIFILTQLNYPLRHLIDYFHGRQASLQFIGRMQSMVKLNAGVTAGTLDVVPSNAGIEGKTISFRYEGENSAWVLKNQDFFIPSGRCTMIHGASGSGKTTLLNLLLKFYQPEDGIIKIGDMPLNDISDNAWLEKCGVVQQDGFIFHRSISQNIVLGDEEMDGAAVYEACRIANVLPFLERFPDGIRTIVGEGGVGLSKGQRQAILIARAVYKKPDYLFLDEATNNLDAETEQLVFERILKAFQGKTVVIIANREIKGINIDHTIHLTAPAVKSSAKKGPSILGGKKHKDLQSNIDEFLISN